MNTPRKAAIAFIFVTVVLDVLSLGVTIPVLPELVKEFSGNDTATAAGYYGLFGFAWALMQFVCSPIIGSLSDRFGRRSVLLISCAGLGLDYILMALAPNLIWLFVGRVISGITAASFATAGAYIADVTPPEKRAASYGIFGAAWGIGFVLGPALGGLLMGFDLRFPFWVAAVLTLLNAVYGYFVLPESLPIEKRRAFSWRRANPLGSIRLLSSHRELLGLAGIFFLYQLAHQVYQSIFVLYVVERYGWDGLTVGLTLMAVGVMNVFVQGGLVRPAVRRFGERPLLYSGLLFGAIGYGLYGLAPNQYYFWWAMPLAAMMGFFGPALQSLMTRRISPTEQGQLQGANSSLMGIAGMLGPLLFPFILKISVGKNALIPLPGSPFFVASLLLLVAVSLAYTVVLSPRAETHSAS